MSEETSGDFTFIHKHKKFVVKQIDAKNASRKIFNIWMSDSLFDEMNIDDGIDGDFSIIQKYIQTGEIKVDSQNAFFLFQIGCFLQNDFLIQKAVLLIPKEKIQKNNDIFLKIYDSGADINYIFYSFPSFSENLFQSKMMRQFPIPLVDIILSFLPPNSKLIKSCLNEIFPNKVPLTHRLFKHINIKSLPREEFVSLLKNSNLGFHRITQIFRLRKTIHIPYNECLPDLGLIQKNKINFFCSSVANPTIFQSSYGPEVMFEDNDHYFCTKNEKNQWLLVDFLKESALIEGYALQSWRCAFNGVCPSSWTLECSNDNTNWKLLDSVENCELLRTSDQICYNKIQNDSLPYRYYRFTQKSTLNPGNQSLALKTFNLYGHILISE